MKIVLKVVAPPKSSTIKVIEINPPEIVFFRGHGDINFICGKCDTVLAESIDAGSLNNMVLKCNKCQSYNLVPYNRRHKLA